MLTSLVLPEGPLSFTEASKLVVDFLKEQIPLGFWAVTRVENDRQVYVNVRDTVYGKSAGESHAWSDSLCQYMVDGLAPKAAPDISKVPLYREAPIAQKIPIAAYIGEPIRTSDGEVYGTLCGLDPEVHGSSLCTYLPTLRLLAALLETILRAEELKMRVDAQNEKLMFASYHDALTGLANRRLFFLRAEDLPVGTGIIMFDLDGFKLVNDTLGHASGDILLSSIAKRIAPLLNEDDLLARLSGDEFAIIAACAKNAPKLAESVLSAMQQPFFLDEGAARVGASIGVAFTQSNEEVKDTLHRADQAMYTSKRNGKNQISHAA